MYQNFKKVEQGSGGGEVRSSLFDGFFRISAFTGGEFLFNCSLEKSRGTNKLLILEIPGPLPPSFKDTYICKATISRGK